MGHANTIRDIREKYPQQVWMTAWLWESKRAGLSVEEAVDIYHEELVRWQDSTTQQRKAEDV